MKKIIIFAIVLASASLFASSPFVVPPPGGVNPTKQAHLNDDIPFSQGGTAAAPKCWWEWDTDATDDYQLTCTNVNGAGTDGIIWYVNEGTDDVVFNGGVTSTDDFYIPGTTVSGYVAIGAAVSANQAVLINKTFPSGSVTSQLNVRGTSTINSGTSDITTAYFNPVGLTLTSGAHGVVSTVSIEEPIITENGGTATGTASLYIKNAATEGDTNHALWIDSGSAALDGFVGIGATASITDATYCAAMISQADTTQTFTAQNTGLFVEALAVNGSRAATAIYSVGKTAGNRSGTGINTYANVGASADTGTATGITISANDTHAGGDNVGISINVSGSSTNNNAISITAGNILNSAALTWNSGAALSHALNTDIATGNAYSWAGAAAGELTGADVAQSFARIAPVINQSGTSSWIGLEVDATPTAEGSGTQVLLDLQTSNASKFKIDDTGQLTSVAGVTWGAAFGMWFSGREKIASSNNNFLQITSNDALTGIAIGTATDGVMNVYDNDASTWGTVKSGTISNTQTKGATTNIKTKTETVTFAGGGGDASKTTTGTLIPDGVFLLGVSSRVVTADTGACTSMDIGVAGGTANLFANDTSVADTEISDNTDATAAWANPILVATEVIVTGVGGNCVTLVVALTSHYIDISADSAD